MTTLKAVLAVLYILCGREYDHLDSRNCYNHARHCFEKHIDEVTITKKELSKIFEKCTEDLQ